MKKALLLPLVILALATMLHAQREVSSFTATPNGTVRVEGDLAQGAPMPDLSWAWNSQNACFVATQQKKFTGNHVLYQTEIPPRSEMTIRVIPADPNANFSIYAYSGGGGAVVPDLPSCVSCEADFKWDYKVRGKTQDHTRSVQLRAVNNPYPVTIGVVGADGLNSGMFTLEVELLGGETAENQPQAPIPTFQASSQKGQVVAYKGDLAQGVPMHDLSWAWSSQNACFPATEQEQFKGNHVLYVTELPANSELTVTLVPENPAAPINLYAYSIGSGQLKLVPNLSSCVSCEASYPQRMGAAKDEGPRRVQLRAVNNPYQVVIGVAGATSGKYQLELDLK